MQNDFSNHPYLGIGASKPRRTETIEPKRGTYLGNVLEFKEVISTKPGKTGRVYFIITMVVEEVIAGGQYVDILGDQSHSNNPGDRISFFIQESWGEDAKAMQKEFLIAAWSELTPEIQAGFTEVQWAEIFCKSLYKAGSPPRGCERMDLSSWKDQPCRGRQVVVTVTERANQDKTKIFPRFQFSRSEADDIPF